MAREILEAALQREKSKEAERLAKHQEELAAEEAGAQVFVAEGKFLSLWVSIACKDTAANFLFISPCRGP